jgi:hypothetical protein
MVAVGCGGTLPVNLGASWHESLSRQWALPDQSLLRLDFRESADHTDRVVLDLN